MRIWQLIGLIVLPSLVGCASYPPVSLSQPGPARLQQGRAVVFDPYPDPSAGPEVVGGRPWGYARPDPEAVQAQRWQPPHFFR